jgi:putative aldouronate transport system substrate-binding protein
MDKLTRREFLRLSALTAGATVLAACAPQAAPTTAPTALPAATKAAATAVAPTTAAATVVPTAVPAAYPIVKEPLTLTYWVPATANVMATLKTFGEMTCYKELEKKTGIRLEFQHPPMGQDTEQFNLVVASGKFPDIIERDWTTAPGGPAKYIKDGVILRLNDLIKQHAPNLNKVLADRPEWKRMIATDEGDIYCFPFLRSDPYLQTFAGLTLRGDWLDKLGLKVPTTIAEWRDVLVAFKTKDPNGNGKADEIGFNPWKDNSARGSFNMYAFVGAWGIGMNWFQDKGVVKYGPLQPEFKEFLKVMAQWFKEGLIDPDYITTNLAGLDAKITGNQIGVAMINTGSGIGKYVPLMQPKDPKFKLTAAPYPVLKAGDKPQLGQRDNAYAGQGSAAITTANKRVVETVKLLDYAYGAEGHILFNFGVEGLTYKMENGYPRYTDEITKNPQKLPMNQAMGKHFRAVFNGPFLQDRRYMEQYSALPEQQEAIKTWMQPSNEKQLPPITPTQEESRKFSTIMAEVTTRYDEAFNKILQGQLPIDAWDQVVKDLKQMGIDDAIKIQQAALDRYNKRP